MFISAFILAAIILVVLTAIMFRVVVPTNEVHIVQSTKKTVSYGKGFPNGNTYYKWPSWIPLIGVSTSSFPLSVFDVFLEGYEAYDSGRVPFKVDVMAFFRVSDSSIAAERVSNFSELSTQLHSILQGSVRSILASHDIEEIMQGRSQFGEMFTKEVDGQLTQWGVQTVKSIEFMDIRDAEESRVIANIMEKKKSMIEKDSRIEVANNRRDAEVAEIDARRVADVQRQDAEQQVGIRTAEKDRVVGINKEQAAQAIQEQAKVTAEKMMEVKQVEDVRSAEIERQVKVVEADREKQTTILIAEGDLKKVTLAAEGVRVDGEAKADAEKALQLAPVQAQITLAKEIGENQGYQTYLIQLREVEARQIVGVEQAKALEKAGIKIISNAGDIAGGVKNITDLFTPKGGTSLGGMLEAFAQTDEGKNLITRFLSKPVAE